MEKDVALAISRELAAVLVQSGRARPLLTRDQDVALSLEERTARANAAGAVLFISVHATEADQLRAIRAGALDYLAKPLSLRVLMAKVVGWRARSAAP